jgi:hypothetical protein
MIRRYFRHEISVDEALKRGWLPSSIRFDVTVQCPHDTDPGEHRRAAKLGNKKQRLHRGLPFRGVVLGLGQLGGVFCRIPERDELATARQRDRVFKRSFPGTISQSSAASPAACARRDQTGDTFPPSRLPGRAMPESRPGSGWPGTPSMRLQSRRGLGRRSPPCRPCIRPVAIRDRTRSATPMARYHADCRCAWRSCRRGRRHSRSASILHGGPMIGGG